jgi:hypothetical protein
MFFDDDVEEEVINTELSNLKIIQVEENIINNKKCRLTALTIPEQEYMFEQRLKEEKKLKEEMNKENKEEIVEIETDNNVVIKMKQKNKSCVMIFDDENANLNLKNLKKEDLNVNNNIKEDDNNKENNTTGKQIEEKSLQNNFKAFMNKRKVY